MGVYVNDNSMVNILSLKEVADSFRITMYTKEYHAMLVHYRNDKACRLKECGKGIYYLDISNPETILLTTESVDTFYYFLSTVNVNVDYFTHGENESAYRARDLQHILVWPSNKNLVNALGKNFIINWPVLSDDMRHAHAIHGPATAILKG